MEMKALYPNDPFPTYALALESIASDMPEVALDLLLDVKSKFPDYLATYYQLGLVYQKLLNPAEAAQTYREGIKLAAEQLDAKTLNELQEALLMLED